MSTGPDLHPADQLAEQVLRDHPLRGLAWGVLHGDQVIASGGAGMADVAAGVPAGPTVASRICSITKTMTAVTVMQLVESGDVSIDDPVNRHLQHFRIDHPDPGSPPITLTHLLTHTAGIGDIHRVRDLRRPFAGLAVREGRPVPSLRELYGPWFRTEVHAGGTKWNYANHGFAILGQMVEDVRGEPWADVLHKQVFEALGMHRTDVYRSQRTGPDRFVGYKAASRLSKVRARPATDIDITVAATGAVWSTIDDLLRYAAELLAPETVLTRETVDVMTRTHFTVDPRLDGRGLAFRVGTYQGHRTFGHDGAIPGWSSTLHCFPDDDVAIVALANANTPAIGAAVHRFTLDVASAELGVASLEDDLSARRVAAINPAVADELCGDWQIGPGMLTSVRMYMTGGRHIRISRADGGSLAARTRIGTYAGGVELVPVDADDPLRFDALTRGLLSSLAFARNKEGRVDRLLANDIDGPLELFRA